MEAAPKVQQGRRRSSSDNYVVWVLSFYFLFFIWTRDSTIHFIVFSCSLGDQLFKFELFFYNKLRHALVQKLRNICWRGDLFFTVEAKKYMLKRLFIFSCLIICQFSSLFFPLKSRQILEAFFFFSSLSMKTTKYAWRSGWSGCLCFHHLIYLLHVILKIKEIM